MRALNEIIVHCTATRAEWWKSKPTAAKVNEVRRWHLDRGWSDIGYHYLIDRDGTVAEGRPLAKTGAHVKGHNTGTVGISLFGGAGTTQNGMFHENFTSKQEFALRDLLSSLRAQYPSITKVSGHNEYANKACPGFNVTQWLNNATPKGSGALSSKSIKAALTAGAGSLGTASTVLTKAEPQVQMAMVAAFTFLVLVGVAFIIFDRRQKQKRGIL